MIVFDWVLLILLALALLLGYKTGLVEGVVTAVSIYVSLLLGGLFAGHVLSLLPLGVESEALSTAIGYVIIFAGVFIASRFVTGAANTALKVSMVDWVNKGGGIVLGVVIWALLAIGLITVTARYTYVFEDPDHGGNPDRRAAQGLLADDLRDAADNMLTESAFVPALLDLRGVLPGGALGMAPADFSTALDILDDRASD